MKKLLYIFTVLASFIVFHMGFQLYAERQYEQLINLEQAYAQEHQQEILTVFLRLDDTHSNISNKCTTSMFTLYS